jgi:COP9 signalosome complex subunit 1
MAMAGLEAAKKYEKEALERVRRMSIAAADLEVKGTTKGGVRGQALSDLEGSKWFEEGARSTYSERGAPDSSPI